MSRIIALLILFFPIVALALQDGCKEISRTCVEPKETRQIEGYSVTKDCWKYKYELDCSANSKNNCNEIDHDNCSFTHEECGEKLTLDGKEFCINRKQYFTCTSKGVAACMNTLDPNCTMIDEECIEKGKIGDKEICTIMRQNYACTFQNSYDEEKHQLIKNNGSSHSKDLMCKFMCLDGSCVKKSKDETSEDDLHIAMGTLASLKDIAKNASLTNGAIVDVWKGESKACDKKFASSTNCCKLGGWGKIFGAHCGEEAANLKKKRTEKKCVPVGTYCHSKTLLGVCTIKRSVFCCYESIIGRILSEEAKKQLGRNNGTPKHPNCGGLTVEELSKVDFSSADPAIFADFYEEIAKHIKLPDVKTDAAQNTNTAQSLKQNKEHTTAKFKQENERQVGDIDASSEDKYWEDEK